MAALGDLPISSSPSLTGLDQHWRHHSSIAEGFPGREGRRDSKVHSGRGSRPDQARRDPSNSKDQRSRRRRRRGRRGAIRGRFGRGGRRGSRRSLDSCEKWRHERRTKQRHGSLECICSCCRRDSATVDGLLRLMLRFLAMSHGRTRSMMVAGAASVTSPFWSGDATKMYCLARHIDYIVAC